MGQEIKNAIVTTPAHFNDAQRSATMDAAKIAGLNVLRILNEPTAAALAYGFKGKGGDESKTVLVFDMGGGTFDVTILSMKGHQHNVIWTDGDTRLGGEDIDMLLVNHMVGAFRRTHGQDISTNEKAKRRLRTSCETAKRRLSVPDVTTTRLYLDSLFGGIDFKYTLTRAEFDDLCQGLFDETMNLVEECLRGASLDKKDIDEIDLVGGSTRVVKIHDLLKVKFPGKPLNMSINADEAVAYGAAVFAANLIGDESNEKIKDLCLVDVTAHSLGIKVEDGVMSFLIAANTSIPTDRTKIYSNSVDNQEIVAICIYEGEATDVYENNLLGTFELPIPPAPKGKMHVKVTFAIDPSGILHVSAVAAGNSNQIIITAYRNRMSQEEIERLAKDAERNRTESRKATDRATAINDLETLARDIQRPMLTSNVSEDVNSPLAANLLSKAVDTLERIKSGEFKEDECENMKKELGELHRAFLDEAAAGKGLPERSVQEDSDQKENKKSVNEDEGGEDHHEQADNDDR